MSKAVVIIPTYNEAGNLPITIEKLAQVFQKINNWQMQILVVDDSSPDGTAEVVLNLQKKYSFLQLLVNKKKAGLGSAYLKGMDQAFNQLGADLVFEFDADLSHDPAIMPLMLKEIERQKSIFKKISILLGKSYKKGKGAYVCMLLRLLRLCLLQPQYAVADCVFYGF